MGYEPTMDRPHPLYPLATSRSGEATAIPNAAPRDTVASVEIGKRRQLRFGGLSLDELTGAVQWRGKPVHLREDELEVLQVLMRNAGRILSAAQLGLRLGERPEAAERRIRALHGSLRSAGVKCLPRHTTGLGYVLWH